MNPADQALVQKYLSTTLAKVASIKKNLAATRATLEQQERALYAATEKTAETQTTPVAAVQIKSPSILDGEVDMSALNTALKKLVNDCDCPNTNRTNFLPKMPEGN